MQMDELLDLLKKDDGYFVGTGWPTEAENHQHFLNQVIGSAEPIAIIAKQLRNW